MQECTGEGENGVLLAKRAVRFYREIHQLPRVIAPLKSALDRTPQMRIDEINPHWVDLAALLQETYTAVGDAKNAKAIRDRIGRLKPAGAGSR